MLVPVVGASSARRFCQIDNRRVLRYGGLSGVIVRPTVRARRFVELKNKSKLSWLLRTAVSSTRINLCRTIVRHDRTSTQWLNEPTATVNLTKIRQESHSCVGFAANEMMAKCQQSL